MIYESYIYIHNIRAIYYDIGKCSNFKAKICGFFWPKWQLMVISITIKKFRVELIGNLLTAQLPWLSRNIHYRTSSVFIDHLWGKLYILADENVQSFKICMFLKQCVKWFYHSSYLILKTSWMSLFQLFFCW